MTKHKHYDCIVAWAEGNEIEFRVEQGCPWTTTADPHWREEIEYRVKPKWDKILPKETAQDWYNALKILKTLGGSSTLSRENEFDAAYSGNIDYITIAGYTDKGGAGYVDSAGRVFERYRSLVEFATAYGLE